MQLPVDRLRLGLQAGLGHEGALGAALGRELRGRALLSGLLANVNQQGHHLLAAVVLYYGGSILGLLQ